MTGCALLGHGYWGRILERYLESSETFDLRYIYTPRMEEEQPLSRILGDGRVEAVFISTPVGTHGELARRCLLAGKHVFCEKPLSGSCGEVEELAGMAKARRKCLYTDYTYTASPSLAYIKKNIEKIGSLRSIEGRITQFGNFYPDTSVYEVLGVHLLSAILHVAGNDFFDGCRGMGKVLERSDRAGACVEGGLSLLTNHGCEVWLYCSLLSEEKARRIVFRGEEGSLTYDMLGEATARTLRFQETGKRFRLIGREERRYEEGDNLREVLEEFYSMTESGAPGNVVLSRAVTEMLERIHGDKEFAVPFTGRSI